MSSLQPDLQLSTLTGWDLPRPYYGPTYTALESYLAQSGSYTLLMLFESLLEIRGVSQVVLAGMVGADGSIKV